MSVHANRIIKIEIEESYNSFNLWHDRKLMDFLDEEAAFFNQLTADGTGVSEAPVEILEKAVSLAVELELDEDTITNLKKDIAWAKEHDEGFVQYYCF
jgi:UDP-N-acetylmuramyl tripeptide synthase